MLRKLLYNRPASQAIAGKPAPGIPCQDAREQASEPMGYVHDLIISGLMDYDQKLIWASRYLSAMAKALLDDAELGMMKK
ncbi:DUF3077 domain-containing protein [Pseudomonas monteilii]|uniref:DUF3077 domain-containing protein n=1 Tax=Pseudomonas TaxID=286 RepID=UPI0005AAC111|nr:MULTISPECIES: DUF3077 domain-containing protein [Pseudomonas]KPM60175.1 hypothetical protein HB4184_21950 [Pseudomonas putida]MCE1008413.1 DUF3077 domain-containing protein [Pseudomonas monteilii]MCE1019670.1 DUF3077 domain-containing protein [Pseudomonas monteilii]MCE1035669.1 DUF3077 domain-containing protein [Pseudomonas monteilii]MCE1087822.1 DUF3077 domain-containing protein [Pseudomonas monteilii]